MGILDEVTPLIDHRSAIFDVPLLEVLDKSVKYSVARPWLLNGLTWEHQFKPTHSNLAGSAIRGNDSVEVVVDNDKRTTLVESFSIKLW